MATPGSVRVAFWHATVFKRFWVSNLLNSFFQPLLYLLGLGVGVGALVDSTAGSTDVRWRHIFQATGAADRMAALALASPRS